MSNKKGVYKFSFDCGRQGSLDGIFVAYPEHVSALIESGLQVYFGEVLGKHSEVCGPIEDKDLTFVSDNKEVVKVMEEHELESGYNPFEYRALDIDHEALEQGDEDLTVLELIEKIIAFKNK